MVINVLEGEPTVSVPWSEDSGLWTREAGDAISESSEGAVDNRLDFFRGVYIVTSITVFTGDSSGRCNSREELPDSTENSSPTFRVSFETTASTKVVTIPFAIFLVDFAFDIEVLSCST